MSTQENPPELTDLSDCGQETRLIRGGTHRSQFGEVSEAIFMNSGFCYDSAETAASRFDGTAPGYVYSRYKNPNLAMLEERLALLEGAESCIVMGSGMAAVFASLMSFLKTGDRVVASRVLFGSCHYIITQILPRFGISYELVASDDHEGWARALAKPTQAVFIESPANPNLEIVDIKYVAKLAHKINAQVIVDNVFATAMYQHPLELGADMVIYSTTKYADGQGRTLGGALLGRKAFLEEHVLPFFRHTGPALSPFNAWVILKGLETLPMRMERHCKNASAVADFLHGKRGISRMLYPHHASFPQYALAKQQMSSGGGMVAFEIAGGKPAAFKFMNALKLIDIANNLGDAKSLITHPATTTHSNIAPDERAALGIGEGLLRLSVGLESTQDLLNDLARGLATTA